METDISIIDDVSLERIFLECSDRTITYFLISIKLDDLSRTLKIISKERKIAIQAELKILEKISYFNTEKEIEIFWEFVRVLESQGQIITRKHTANGI